MHVLQVSMSIVPMMNFIQSLVKAVGHHLEIVNGDGFR